MKMLEESSIAQINEKFSWKSRWVTIHSSTDNFSSPILVSDWLAFCWKKSNGNDKNKFFDEKQQENFKKKMWNSSSIVYSELVPVI